MGKLFSTQKFEKAEKSPDQIKELEDYLKKYIEEHEEEIKNFFDGNNSTSKIYKYKTKIQNSQMEFTEEKHEPRDYSIKMIFDVEELPLHLELYNIGGLLSKNGILYRIIMFYSFCCSINMEEGMDEKEKKLRINQCLKAIDDNDIKFLESVSELKICKILFNLIKSGYNIIKSWFPGAYESIVDTILGRIKSYLLKTLSKFLFTNIGLVSGVVLLIFGIIVSIPTVFYAKSEQKEINKYIKEKNRINLDIILEKIRAIFMVEEAEVLDFFRNNNIYALAYDINKNYFKNAGAAFFAHNIKGMGKKARQLKKDSKTGFDTENYIDESQIYECYEKNILEIMNFFKDTKDNFKRILILPKHENLNENKDFKAITEKLVQVNEKAIKENNDIITTTNLIDDSITKPLLDKYSEEDTIIIVPKILEDENKNKEIEKLSNRINELNKVVEQYKKDNKNLTNLNNNSHNQITDLQGKLAYGYNKYEELKKDFDSRLAYEHNLYEEKKKDYDKLKEGYEGLKNLIRDDEEKTNTTNKYLETNSKNWVGC